MEIKERERESKLRQIGREWERERNKRENVYTPLGHDVIYGRPLSAWISVEKRERK